MGSAPSNCLDGHVARSAQLQWNAGTVMTATSTPGRRLRPQPCRRQALALEALFGYHWGPMKTSLGSSAPINALCIAAALLLLSAGCDDDRVGVGKDCELGADCEGALVCALLAEGGMTRVCAEFSETYTEPGCDPSQALDSEGNPSRCGLILEQAANAPCSADKECLSEACSTVGDAGNALSCAP